MCAVELIDVQMIGQVIYFFFQAEDGIRDPLVTGVQTCALPIFVEQKEAHKADASLKKGLKCFGNAGAYGPLVELNEQNEGADVTLDVYSGEHYHRQSIREQEVPGPFYFPPVASLITAGGRLLLALAEKSVTDAGGT